LRVNLRNDILRMSWLPYRVQKYPTMLDTYKIVELPGNPY
jgi:hypothetical protein